MERRQVKLKCPSGLHNRPAAVITRVSKLFSGCEIAIVRGRIRIDTHHTVTLAQSGLRNQEQLTLEANGQAEAAAAKVMETLIGSLHLVNWQGSEYEFLEGLSELYTKLLRTLRRITPALPSSVIGNLRGAVGLAQLEEVYTTNATFTSARGMHALPATLLNSLTAEFESSIQLLFITQDGSPQSVNIADTWRVIAAGIPTGADIVVEARGKDCRQAASSVKNVLEHMDAIVRALEVRRGSGVTSRDIMRPYLCKPEAMPPTGSLTEGVRQP